jgi:hypothetical protein
VLAVGLVAGGVRVLPILLAPQVPLRVAPVLARGVLGMSLETALFVAPAIAWALAAARLVDRGEARALFAIGTSPLGIVATGWPAALGVLAAAAIAAFSWGREAAVPGRVIRDLLAEARAACAAAPPPAVADVPLLGVSWVCLEGEPPRVIGPAPAGQGVLAARAIAVSDDLRALDAEGLELVLPAPDGGTAHVSAAIASIRGLSPIARAGNLSVPARAALLATSSAALAAIAAAIALAASIRSRPAALALGAAGPASALLVFSALERSPASPAAYAAVPLAGLLALLAAWLIARRLARSAG